MTLPPVVLETVSKPKDKYLRWFSRRHAARFHLNRRMQPVASVTLQRTVVTQDGCLAYIKNSKVACTTLTAAMHIYDYGAPPQTDVHRSKKLRQGYRYWEKNLDAMRSGATVFSFVRNPASRIRSAFINFCIDKTNTTALKHHDALLARGLEKRSDPLDRFDVFLDYVEESLLESRERTDHHWRPQTLNTGITIMDISFVGRLEDGLENGLAKVRELAGCQKLSLPSKSLNASSMVDFQLTAAQISKVERLYADDYENFGY